MFHSRLPRKQASHAHAGANTHAHNAQIMTIPPHAMHQGTRHPGARGAEGMTQGNSTTGRIHPAGGPGVLQAQLSQTIKRLARKGLVDLPPVHVADGQAMRRQQLGDGEGGADAHLVGRAADDGRGHKLANNPVRQAEARGGAPAHEQRRGGAVRDLARVAGGRGAAGLEGGLQAGERLDGDVFADAVVPGDGEALLRADLGPLAVDLLEARGDGDDLGVEEAGGAGGGGAAVRLGGEGVLVRARDGVALGDVLARQAHGHEAVPGVADGRGGQRGPGVDWDGAAGVVARHALHARGDGDARHAAPDLARHGGHGLQRRRARPVDGEEGRRARVPDVVHGRARRLGAPQLREHHAHAHVLDQRAQVRPRHAALPHMLEHAREQLLRVRVLEAALVGARDGCADRREDDHVGRRLGEDVGHASGACHRVCVSMLRISLFVFGCTSR